jgi:predicted  nucleic acid-binding Zn-ribbon protein
MPPDLKSVIRLQDLDIRVEELTREISALPVHISEIEKKLETHQRKLEADRAALSANQKERKKAETDIEIQNQKVSKLKGQMLEAKTNEVYRAFQNEIGFCEKEIRRFEDRILELMTESEPLEKNVKAAEIALAEEKKQVDAEKQQARERTAADINANLYRNYERIRKGRRGIAVAEAVDGRCVACHMAMRLQFFQDLRKSEQVMHCESCGRILYYNPPVPVEDLGSEAAQATPR